MTSVEMITMGLENAVDFVDLRYRDSLGGEGHYTLTRDEWARWIDQGDRTRVRFRVPHATRLLAPAIETAVLDPFCQHPTLAVLCESHDALTGAAIPEDPRGLARRAEAYLAATGVAETAAFGLALEFFVFDRVTYEQSTCAAHYAVESREGIWRAGRDEPDNLGTQIPPGQGATCLPPADSLHNLRSEIVATLAAFGIPVTGHAHGPATGGQMSIHLAPAPLVAAADHVVRAKYVVRNVVARYGKVATFMPLPLCGEAGSGLWTTVSLSRDGRSILRHDGEAELAPLGRWAVGGLLQHAASLLAFTCPTTNSYRRPMGDLLRTPSSAEEPAALEFLACDATCDPYLAFSALLMAAVAGIQQHIEPTSAALPRSLDESLAALAADHEYLVQEQVFPGALVERWIEHKRQREIDPLRARPHPYEFCLYFNA